MTKTVKALLEKLRALFAQRNKIDLRMAHAVRALLTAADGDAIKVRAWLVSSVHRTSAEALQLVAAAQALEVMQDTVLWGRIGGEGVLEVVKIPSPQDRDLCCAELARRAAVHGEVGIKTVREVVVGFLPKRRPSVNASTRLHPAVERDLLKADLLRIVKKFPQAAALLDPRVRRVLNLDEPAPATRSRRMAAGASA